MVIVKNTSFIILFILLIFFTVNCNRSVLETNSYSQANANGKAKNSDYIVKGKVKGTISQINFTEQDLQTSIISQPLPKIWLIFSEENLSPTTNNLSNSNGVKIDLPNEANIILTSYWKSSLNFRYNTEFEKTKTADEYKKKMQEIIFEASEAKNELQKVLIKTPYETRTISYEEAGKLVNFISSSAVEISKQFKQQKGNLNFQK